MQARPSTAGLLLAALGAMTAWPMAAIAHAVAEGDKGYIQEITGVHLIPFAYLGAKHMVTGYDHLLFLAGVIFFLYRLRHIATYVTLFAVGHSTTMIAGVYFDIAVSAYIPAAHVPPAPAASAPAPETATRS